MKKTVLVTGASRGIGEAIALLFGEMGYNVAVNYNNNRALAESLCEKIRGLGGSARAIQADVSLTEQAESLVSRTIEGFGSLEVLVNNAGVSWQGLFQQMTDEDYQRVMDVNLKGAFNCTRAALPHMIRGKSGSIVNLSSVLGVYGGSCEVVYSASKAAIIGMTKALAKEVGPSGIRVNCVAPGVIETDMNRCHSEETLRSLCDDTALCRLGTPKQVAQAVFFLASENSSFITGQVLGVDGGLCI